MVKFKCFKTTLTYQNYIHDTVMSRLNSGNACYHSVQNLLSSCLLSKNINTKMYKAVILPVVLYGYGTWSLTLQEEHGLRVFQSRVLMKVFGPKRDEVTGYWETLCNEEHHDFFLSPNIIQVIKSRRMRCVGYVAHMGEGRGAYRVLVGKPEVKRPLERPRHRWEDNIKICLFQLWSLCGSQLYVISAVPFQLR